MYVRITISLEVKVWLNLFSADTDLDPNVDTNTATALDADTEIVANTDNEIRTNGDSDADPYFYAGTAKQQISTQSPIYIITRYMVLQPHAEIRAHTAAKYHS